MSKAKVFFELDGQLTSINKEIENLKNQFAQQNEKIKILEMENQRLTELLTTEEEQEVEEEDQEVEEEDQEVEEEGFCRN
jgi:regulator of replication initiation timing